MTELLDKYRGVIKMTFAANVTQSPDVFYEELKKSIQIADALMDDMGVANKPVPRQAFVALNKPVTQSFPKVDASKAILISAVAPPVAGVSNKDNDLLENPEDDVDHWETKPGKQDGCNRLETYLKKILPQEITVQVPGVEQPLKLIRGVGGPGLKFVYVTYTLSGDNLGTRYTLTTANKRESIDSKVILDDIMAQAASFYSSEKRSIQPHLAEKPFVPTNADLQRILDNDRKNQRPNDGLSQDEVARASEDANYFKSQARSDPRWQ